MKKNLSASFQQKYTFICWTKRKTTKLLATVKQLIGKNCLLFEKPYNFFHGANAQINFITHFSSPVRFRLLFKDPVSPLHEERTFWIPPFRENLWTAASKCWFISHWLTSLNIKTSKIWREQKLIIKKLKQIMKKSIFWV